MLVALHGTDLRYILSSNIALSIFTKCKLLYAAQRLNLEEPENFPIFGADIFFF